ncbi:hypothetical protein [Dongia sp.]|uniref:hypothetical protein n=1 Tax=Dongia sp. TaxID=1977262 RepID=UPI0035AFBCB6
MPGGPGLLASSIVFLIALGLGVTANLQMRRPYERRWHGIPWFAIQFIAVVICFTLIMHIGSLLAGHELGGRTRY